MTKPETTTTFRFLCEGPYGLACCYGVAYSTAKRVISGMPQTLWTRYHLVSSTALAVLCSCPRLSAMMLRVKQKGGLR